MSEHKKKSSGGIIKCRAHDVWRNVRSTEDKMDDLNLLFRVISICKLAGMEKRWLLRLATIGFVVLILASLSSSKLLIKEKGRKPASCSER